MSTLSSARQITRAAVPSFSFGRAVAFLAGTIEVGIDALMNRVELHRSRRQLAELDDRLLRGDPAHASVRITIMTSFSSQPVKAVLGPTNTGKTHLAVERLTAHSSGMIGFPLRAACKAAARRRGSEAMSIPIGRLPEASGSKYNTM